MVGSAAIGSRALLAQGSKKHRPTAVIPNRHLDELFTIANIGVTGTVGEDPVVIQITQNQCICLLYMDVIRIASLNPKPQTDAD